MPLLEHRELGAYAITSASGTFAVEPPENGVLQLTCTDSSEFYFDLRGSYSCDSLQKYNPFEIVGISNGYVKPAALAEIISGLSKVLLLSCHY